jgi:hypothetical protein
MTVYLDLSPTHFVDRDDIICILDMDKTTSSRTMRDYLRHSERQGRLKNTASDIPKSIVVTDTGVFFAQPSVSSLKGRIS